MSGAADGSVPQRQADVSRCSWGAGGWGAAPVFHDLIPTFSLLSVSDVLDLCSLVLRISVSTLQAFQGRLQCMTVYSRKLPPAQL